MRLTWFALGLFVGAGACAAIVIYARRMRAYEELVKAQAAARMAPAPPPLPPAPQPPQPIVGGVSGAQKVREIARERAGAKPVALN